MPLATSVFGWLINFSICVGLPLATSVSRLLPKPLERLDEDEQHVIGELLEGMVSKYEANRFRKIEGLGS